MPNWCYTYGNIRFRRKKDADKVEKELDSVKEYARSDFGRLWLGNLLLHLGYDKEEVLSGNVCACRGSLDYYERTGDREITFDEETAWNPMLRCITLFTEKYTDDFTIQYEAEEEGCEVFISNMRDYYGKYKVDVWNPDEVPEELACLEPEPISEKNLKPILKKAVGLRDKDRISMEMLLEATLDYYGDHLSINRFSFVPIEDLE